MSEGQGAFQGEPAEPVSTEGAAPEIESGQESEQSDNSLSEGFLQQIPEADRDIVARYAPAWDAGVTRRFQQIHQEYEPYKQLGDPQQLQEAMYVYKMMDEQPEEVFKILQQVLNDGSSTPQQVQQASGLMNQLQDGGAGEAQGQPVQGLPKEWEDRFLRNEKILEAIANKSVAEQQAAQAQQEDQELQQYMDGLKAEFQPLAAQHGDFDEVYVVSRLAAGIDGAVAVKEYYGMLQEAINRHAAVQAGAPAILSGGGPPPVQGQTVTDLGKPELKTLVADMISHAVAQDKG